MTTKNPKPTHGGKRKRAGRKPLTSETLIPLSVRVTRSQADFLYLYGQQDRGAGLRKLIDEAIARGDLGTRPQ